MPEIKIASDPSTITELISRSIMRIETRSIRSDTIAEIYLTATPSKSTNLRAQIEEIFSGIVRILRANNSRIIQERVFGTEEALAQASLMRPELYDELDDGVAPTWLVSPAGVHGPLAGVQVHAICGCNRPEILRSNDKPCGRLVRLDDLSYLTLSSIRQSKIPGRTNQARAMFEKAESVLKQTGVDFLKVPRTWMWLENILGWYGDFNLVRNTFFKERGVIASQGNHRMPASTGIGIRTENGALCAMELTAVCGEKSRIQYLAAGGKQESAFEYGSAFSRACRARTPAGDTVYISGTASIGADGKTMHVGNPQAQIEATIENVRAVLKECHCDDGDVVQAIAYSKTPEIDAIFAGYRDSLHWPIVPVIADICRDELLFEIEVTAAKK